MVQTLWLTGTVTAIAGAVLIGSLALHSMRKFQFLMPAVIIAFAYGERTRSVAAYARILRQQIDELQSKAAADA
jgi:hypothetical protein